MEEKIAEIFDKYEVTLGYIFGSYARGTAGPLSDIDVAIVFSHSLSRSEQEEKENMIRSEVGHVFKTNYVDLVNLMKNDDPALRYSILFEGKAILIKDKALKISLELKAVRDFEDTKYLREVQFKILKNKINVTSQ